MAFQKLHLEVDSVLLTDVVERADGSGWKWLSPRAHPLNLCELTQIPPFHVLAGAMLGSACVCHSTPKGLKYRIGMLLPDRMTTLGICTRSL